MSEYAYVDGWFAFTTEEELEDALEKLSDGGWLGNWFDRDEITDSEELLIQIPHGHYRNLHRHLDNIGATAEEYHVVSASSDGYFMGWVDTQDGFTQVELSEWSGRDFSEQPDEFEQLVEWQKEVMQSFLDENRHEPPVEA